MIDKNLVDKVNGNFSSYIQMFSDTFNEQLQSDNKFKLAKAEMDGTGNTSSLEKMLPNITLDVLCNVYDRIDGALDSGNMLPGYLDYTLKKFIFPYISKFISGFIIKNIKDIVK